ncbi:MAG: HprK-related kinase A [Nitrosomonadales bacterium]|nr:MAG: HprK-related kinase A [Nitrosomonadales bacterium]
MNVSSLTLAELEFQLKKTGIFLQTGSFITHLQTSIPGVAEGIGLLYADYPLLEQTDFTDFHVSLAYPRTLRRWFKPQVLFLFDGKPPFKPLPLDQAFPMFEWGLNWCVSSHANHCLIIHAAVVEKGGYAAILPAPPGSGKSTLCAALVNRGWRLLSDELALVRVSDGLIIPLPRPVSLKNASIDVIRHYEPEATLSRRISDTMKGTVAHMKVPADSIARAAETARPAWVIFPKYQAGAATRLEALPRARAFMRVADNAFNYSLLGVRGFETMAGLIDASLCYDFTYSVLDEAIETFAELKPPVSLM